MKNVTLFTKLFFFNRESQQRIAQETHATRGFSTETRTEMPI